MVYFIGREKNTKENIDIVREQLFKNTEKLLSLFQERLSIANVISDIKEKQERPTRDRKRELCVIERIGDIPNISRKFLNMLFELTIIEEAGTTSFPVKDISSKRKVSISADLDEMETICARLLCSPGTEVFSPIGKRSVFIEIASEIGAHIIEEKCDDYDFKICSGKNSDPCDIAINEGKPMNIPFEIITFHDKISRILYVGE